MDKHLNKLQKRTKKDKEKNKPTPQEYLEITRFVLDFLKKLDADLSDSEKNLADKE